MRKKKYITWNHIQVTEVADLNMELFNIIFDLGGVLSLIATIIIATIIMLKFEIHKEIAETLKETPSMQVVVIPVLLLIGLISLWLTIRAIGIYTIKRYILTVNYSYQQENIFDMLALVLTTNMCFTLVKAFMLEGKNKSKNKSKNENTAIKGLIDVAIQAAIVGFITFIPRHHHTFLALIGGSISYALIVVSIMVSIVVLVFARQRLTS